MQFGSDEWIKALRNELNQSAAYADAAKDWEGDFYFVIEPEGAQTEPVYLYMDLWHGKCRDAFLVPDRAAKNPAFEMAGLYPKWKKVVSGQLDPIQGLMTGQFKLKGNLVQVMKNVRAATELVKACTRVSTEFAM
ncbi:MAG: SCP2 sterol-binding domain-containing protein [Chloroflexi bacterium]|nr:SCP2 sterol-binding domain-containing protein [Chloroflexota bacterium]